MSDPQPLTVYTDGACQGNPGPGGWAWAIPEGDYRSGADRATTNQRMELLAVLDAVTTLPSDVTIVSDSTYVVNCFKNKWWEGWLRQGWKNSQRQPVANRDLWEPLIDAYRAAPDRLSFRWVKGHSGDRMNDLVDRLAVEAAARQEGRSGTGTPSDLGQPDAPWRPARSGATVTSIRPSAGGTVTRIRPAAGGTVTSIRPGAAAGAASDSTVKDGPQSFDTAGAGVGGETRAGAETGSNAGLRSIGVLSTGYRLLVTGLRPPGLGGYDDNLVAASVRRRLVEVLAAQLVMHPDVVVTSGLGLGAEQLGAEAAREAGVPYVAVLAFSEQDRMWPASSKARFALLVDGATDALVIDGRTPTDKPTAGRALARRDEWLASNADGAIVVWDTKDEPVGRTARALQRRLGDEQVWILET